MNPERVPEKNKYGLLTISFKNIQLNNYKGKNLQF
jgi:hypothetical protein